MRIPTSIHNIKTMCDIYYYSKYMHITYLFIYLFIYLVIINQKVDYMHMVYG